MATGLCLERSAGVLSTLCSSTPSLRGTRQDLAEHAERDGQHAPATNWLTIAEAAAALGVSVDTVRRRLKRGELRAEQAQTERGPAAPPSMPCMTSSSSGPSC
jgi:hypothetical protein